MTNDTLVILSINDVYDMEPDPHGQGGIAQLSSLLQKEKERMPSNATVLVTLNGDFLSGSSIAERCKGAHMIEILNYLCIDYVVLGNHEFDFGLDTLLQRVSESSCQWLGANVRRKSKDNALLTNVAAYDVLTLRSSNIRIGIFGICTVNTPHISFPGDDVLFQDVVTASRDCVDALLNEHHVDFIIALTHLSLAEDKQLAQSVPAIHFILGGHDHEPFTFYQNSTLIHKSGQNANWLARFEFAFLPSKDTERKAVHFIPQWQMIANFGQIADPKCRAILAKYDTECENRVLALLEKPLRTFTRELRTMECNMGNLVADALRRELSADVGLINGGFIRGDQVYEAKSSVTLQMLEREMPFPRPSVVVKIQWSDFRQALMQHFALYPEPSGAFPHVSGVVVTLDTRTNPRSLTLQMEKALSQIDSDPFIYVATSLFVALGGDGCTFWKKGSVVSESASVGEIVARFMARQRILSYNETEDRVCILNGMD